jgi:hypothetical protein
MQEVKLILQDLSDKEIIQPILLTTRNVHTRIFTAAKKDFLRFGNKSRFLENQVSPAEIERSAARTDRRGYFLDPWNNAYWIYYLSVSNPSPAFLETDTSRVFGSLIVYSMGPNRRRDTDLASLRPESFVAGSLAGDDIGMGFLLSH